MPKITYIDTDDTERTVEAEIGTTVMETAVNNDVPGILATCGGSCLVQDEELALPTLSAICAPRAPRGIRPPSVVSLAV